MSEKGSVLIDRRILDWEFSDDSTVFAFFIKLIIAVNTRDKRWKGVIIRRGSILGSTDSLCTALKVKRDSFLRCRNLLSEAGTIKVKTKKNQYQIITVRNYNYYQNKKRLVEMLDGLVVGDVVDISDNSTDNRTDNSTDNRTHTTNTIPLKGYSEAVKKIDEVSPLALEGRRLTSKEISFSVINKFSREAGVGTAGEAAEFFRVFDESKTCFPDWWRDLFTKYCGADGEAQDKFLKSMLSGDYRERWGAADAED